MLPENYDHYHVFLASPNDVQEERQAVRDFFARCNRTIAKLWKVQFDVVDWENYSTIGIGRPQELINRQTLEKHKASLALVIGILGQRFGSPTGEADSGTEEEFNWAMEHHQEHGYPEIKWFFRAPGHLPTSSGVVELEKAVEQWKKVVEFRNRMQSLDHPLFYKEYPSATAFPKVLEDDLNLWLSDAGRPWVPERPVETSCSLTKHTPPAEYYSRIEQDFHRLDIAGIDNEKSFEIPLSEIYVQLRVMFGAENEDDTDLDDGPIDIQTALVRYKRLVIVGDPGSGKSTFLKYIALMLARSLQDGDPAVALAKLSLPDPLPLPIFLSCWDLADFLKKANRVRLEALVDFIVERLGAYGYDTDHDDVEAILRAGGCCLLFDGLDEVPTDAGRANVSRLLEECVKKYSDNRFVVTSRVRAYTGDTILKGEFTRCDIQDFDKDNRSEFLQNWVALLTKTEPANVPDDSGAAGKEFRSLRDGIEHSGRIRPLAVNPLLLTVIAIVHWNRKRLPEQRVDLYDECVDVLLGQRKEAEHALIARSTESLDEQREDGVMEDRAWVRKRFAEIALHILDQDGDREEVSKSDLAKLLIPRYLARGAVDDEQAIARAERFLERQELSSGLLVSRRANNYRFVHLTFQEYLASWHLSNSEAEKVFETIEPHLREAKWFETLQLLGAEWARESDDKADIYVAWLLARRGSTIEEEAPVVALCANIVRDIDGVAELSRETRGEFDKAVKNTLDAFRQGSGVPASTQIEILEALSQLGSAVKSHLVDATKASLYQVRETAIHLLIPHLSDDELFGMTHIFEDRSRNPIGVYMRSLMGRSPERALSLLEESHKSLPVRAKEAIVLCPYWAPRHGDLKRRWGVISFCSALEVNRGCGDWLGVNAVEALAFNADADPALAVVELKKWAKNASSVRARDRAIDRLCSRLLPDKVSEVLKSVGLRNTSWEVRLHTLFRLNGEWLHWYSVEEDDRAVIEIARNLAMGDASERVRQVAIRIAIERAAELGEDIEPELRSQYRAKHISKAESMAKRIASLSNWYGALAYRDKSCSAKLYILGSINQQEDVGSASPLLSLSDSQKNYLVGNMRVERSSIPELLLELEEDLRFIQDSS